MASMLFAYGSIWMVAENPRRRNICIAALVALISVQCVYYNSIMVMVFCAAGALIGLRRRGWRGIVPFLVIGAVALFPMVFYLGMIERLHSWNVLVHRDIGAVWLWRNFSKVLAAAGPVTYCGWLALFIVGVVTAFCFQLRSVGKNLSAVQKDLLLYAATAMSVGAVAHFIFLFMLHYPTEPWYYLTLVALIAVSVDAVFGVLAYASWFRMSRLALAVLPALICFNTVLNAVEIRQTNVDLIAKKLTLEVAPGDLVIVDPWFVGLTFQRYYNGPAPWDTLPPMEFHTYHRYDIIKERMMATHPIDSLLSRAEDVLRSGHHVWVVGTLPGLPPGSPEPYLPPAPQSPAKWEDSAYIELWHWQAGYFFQTHAIRGRTFSVPDQASAVNHYEKHRYQVFEGAQAVPGQQRFVME
jgi:hypothetical protein